MALALFPEKVRHDALHNQREQQQLLATAEKGALLAEATVAQTVAHLKAMIAGAHRAAIERGIAEEVFPPE